MKIKRYNQINESKREDLIKEVLEDLFIDYIDRGKFYDRMIRFSTYVIMINGNMTETIDRPKADNCYKAYTYTSNMNDIVDIDEFEKEITRQVNTNIIKILNYNVTSNSELKKGFKNKITHIKIWFVDLSQKFALNEETKSIFNKAKRMGFSKSFSDSELTYQKRSQFPLSKELEPPSKISQKKMQMEFDRVVKEFSEKTIKIIPGSELKNKGKKFEEWTKKTTNGSIEYYIEVYLSQNKIMIGEVISFRYTENE
jgi:hypothetical protein